MVIKCFLSSILVFINRKNGLDNVYATTGSQVLSKTNETHTFTTKQTQNKIAYIVTKNIETLNYVDNVLIII